MTAGELIRTYEALLRRSADLLKEASSHKDGWHERQETLLLDMVAMGYPWRA